MRAYWKIGLAGLAALGAPLAAAADEEGAVPGFAFGIDVEVQNDWTFRSDDPTVTQNELGPSIAPWFALTFSENLSLNGSATIESVSDPQANEDRAFHDIGAFVDVLTLDYTGDSFAAFIGKFGPNFSLGYDATPGLYSTDLLGDDIELAELVGFGGSLGLGEGGPMGALTLSGSVFFADTTGLSGSAFTDRGKLTLADGGPANTEAPKSFVVALDGEGPSGLESLHYQVAFARLAVDQAFDATGAPFPSVADEMRVSVAATWEADLGNDITMTPLVEYIRVWNGGGDGDDSRHYATLGLGFGFGPWNVAVAGTARDVSNPTAGSSFDYQTQFSGGYAFDNGISVDVGWKHARDARIDTDTVGVLFAYGFEF